MRTSAQGVSPFTTADGHVREKLLLLLQQLQKKACARAAVRVLLLSLLLMLLQLLPPCLPQLLLISPQPMPLLLTAFYRRTDISASAHLFYLML